MDAMFNSGAGPEDDLHKPYPGKSPLRPGRARVNECVNLDGMAYRKVIPTQSSLAAYW